MILIIILVNLCFLLIPISSKAEGKYDLGFFDKTNFTLIYEYTLVDSDKLEYLYLQTGLEIYENLAKIDEGEKYKISIVNIEKHDEYWEINSALYSGENLDERGKDLEYRIYKNPEDLVNEIFEDDENEFSLFSFIPVKVEDYLTDFDFFIQYDIRYYEEEFTLYINEREISFDYTYSGYSDIINQEYNEDGILETLTLLIDGEEAYKKELISSYEDYEETIFISIISIITSSSLCMTFFLIYYRRKKKVREGITTKIDKLLSKIK